MRITVSSIKHHYGNKELFCGLSFEANGGDFLVIHGASGSGKSTLLNLIAGLDKPQNGTIKFFDELNNDIDQYNRKFRRDYLNYMFQNFALLEKEDVKFNLMLPLLESRDTRVKKMELIKESLVTVGLTEKIDCSVTSLSGGEQQRVALARILLKKGDLILADEPTGNLDESNAEIIVAFLKKLQERGKLVIVVTHDSIFSKHATKTISL